MEKKLTRSESDAIIFGVCSGIGHYFSVDPTVIRLVWAILALLGGSGIIAYIIAAIIMPSDKIQ